MVPGSQLRRRRLRASSVAAAAVIISVWIIGASLPPSVQSLPDCGLASRHSLHGRSSRASTGSPLDWRTRTSPQVESLSRTGHERLWINNLFGGPGNATGGQPHGAMPNRRRDRRRGRIIMGRETDEGQYPWQASLQLLHPVLGFIGHWCGGVLIHQNWILSAAHCVHNDLFNLATPDAWSVVLGDYDRHIESGYEQRIAIDRIVMHDNYENYQHDVVLMRLARPADLHQDALARKICLPFPATSSGSWSGEEGQEEQQEGQGEDRPDLDSFDGSSNNLRKLQMMRRRGAQMGRRRNDKFVKERRLENLGGDEDLTGVNHQFHFAFDKKKQQQQHQEQHRPMAKVNDLPYRDCVATGWGMMTANGELTDILLQSKVPLLSNNQCQRAYRGYVKIHSGHLCGGKADGEGGTCVGDSGGPLQCRISKNGPWILAGITSFGWNCSENVPDVFTRISYYVNWITDTINER